MMKHSLLCMIVISAVCSVQCMEHHDAVLPSLPGVALQEDGLDFETDETVTVNSSDVAAIDQDGNEVRSVALQEQHTDLSTCVPLSAQSSGSLPPTDLTKIPSTEDSITTLAPSRLLQRTSPTHAESITASGEYSLSTQKQHSRNVDLIMRALGNVDEGHPELGKHFSSTPRKLSWQQRVAQAFCCRRKK